MKFTVYNHASGEVLRSGDCPEHDLEIQAAAGESVVAGDFPYGKFFWNGFSMTPIPPRPADHEWSVEAKAWQPNISAAKAAKHAAIELERDRRIKLPAIVYDGKNLDADPESIDRLSKKLEAIRSREARGEVMPPGACFWRDADNVTHSFAGHAEYKAWLCGFAVALDDRGTLAFAWSWQKKNALDAATTLAQIEAINLQD